MKKIIALLLTLSILIFTLPTLAKDTKDFITVQNGIFMSENEPYEALGACLYLAQLADYDYILRTVREAKANGITLIRVVDLWEGVFGGDDSQLYSESVWERVDYIIKVCDNYDMRVLLDISSLRSFLYNSPERRDSYDTAVFPLWEEVIEFICNRKNTFTSVVYSEDPVIMSYAFAGEPVCYGGELNDWSNGIFSSRSVEDIKNSFFYTADTIRKYDKNHLISSGGLLHITPKGEDGNEIYKSIWSYKNIDYGSIHIYPGENDGMGEWENLSTYRKYCASIGKPLMMEEFGDGGSDIEYKEKYIAECFDRCSDNDLPIVIFWNWSVGSSFDIFSNMSGMMDIIHNNARKLGFDGEFLPMANPAVYGETLISFEDNNVLFSPNTTDPGYSQTPYVSQTNSSDGNSSLCVPVSFNTQYEWYWLNYSPSSPLSLEGECLAADVYIPEDAAPLYAKFSINGVEQSESGRINNYILPGQWNTIYLAIDGRETAPNEYGFSDSDLPDMKNVYSIGLLFLNMNGLYGGNIYIDNIRTGSLSLLDSSSTDLEIRNVTISNQTISVDVIGPSNDLSYSYYIFKEGKIYFSCVYTNSSIADFGNLESGKYNVRVYVENSKKRAVYAKSIII